MLHTIGRKVILVAHGQGTMLATAALVQPGCRPADDHPALVTFGSTVGKIYSWGFPAYVDPQMLEPLKPGGTGRLVDWRNLYYLTDPIGGPATGNPPRPDGAVDRVLLDPPHCWWVYMQDPPMPRGHSGYWQDPRVWTQVNKVATAARSIPGTAAGQLDVPASPPQEAAEGSS